VLSVVRRDAPELPGLRVAVAAAAANGLTGHYYSRRLDSSSASGIDYAGLYGVSIDEFGLPIQRRAADATRIDMQIAFARPRVARYDKEIPRLEWWTPANTSAVVWKGYLRLPKAGTYYVTTISQGASSVHLNRSRVALNAPFGGAIREDAFTYGDVGAPDVSSYATGHYAVPVTVGGPRDLPLEVRYAFHEGAVPWIDLYWVTPESPRDAAGKPIAEIIPATALFVEAPGPVAEAQVSGPHSTISSDVLYLDTKADSLATLTIRVADKQGRPLLGKRVHVANLASYGFKDTVLQPQAPTNAQGITTAQVKPYAAGHTAKFFATVLDEAVDIGQVAEVEVFQAGNLALLPRGFAPYYSETFTISPKPLVVGQPTRITVPVGNPLKVPLELSVRFLNNMANIGSSNWTTLGETEKFVLKPGETREFSITWTPQKEEGHLCFAVEVWGRELPQRAERENPLTLFVSAYAQAPAAPAPASGGSSMMDRRQQNLGSVTLPPCGFSEEYDRRDVPIHSSPCVPSEAEKYYCRVRLASIRLRINEFYDALYAVHTDESVQLTEDEVDDLRVYTADINDREAIAAAYDRCEKDPPDPEYKRLAAAVSDTPAGFLHAVTTSMERYQGAEAQGDAEWMSRHLTAQRLYLKRHAEALRRAADAMQESAEGLPLDDPRTLSAMQSAQSRRFERWRRGERFSQDQRKWFKEVGISEERATTAIDALAASKDTPPARSRRTLLLETATLYRESADEAERVPRPGASTGVEGKAGAPISQTYLVGNPHDREETIDLRIRRASLPSEWKLSIVNGESSSAGQAPQVLEVEAGRHYRVRLPAKGQLSIASVVVPAGVVGENTTARWAVEGKIGDELIGGMVHAMHVPGFLPDLELPAVGSLAATTVPGAAGSLDSRWRMTVMTVGIALALFAMFFLIWRRRRKAEQGG
jgi:hypothetical protein